MLWPSISRWKFQRSRIGKLANSTWYFSSANRPTTSGLSASTAASSSRWWRCSDQRLAGSMLASQSTTLPSMANSSASNAPIRAVHRVITAMYGRRPAVPCQRKAKNERGGVAGLASG
jgi:hypothetical protein